MYNSIYVASKNKDDIFLTRFNDIEEARQYAKYDYLHTTTEELRRGWNVEIWLCVDENPEETGNYDCDIDDDFEIWKVTA